MVITVDHCRIESLRWRNNERKIKLEADTEEKRKPWPKTTPKNNSFIYPLTAGVVGKSQMTSQRVFSIFSVLHCPLGLGEFQACPFPDAVFPPHPFSALSSSPFHCTSQGGFGQTWWKGDMTYHYCLRLFTMVRRSSCGPIACWILARTSSLVTWSLYEMHSIFR